MDSLSNGYSTPNLHNASRYIASQKFSASIQLMLTQIFGDVRDMGGTELWSVLLSLSLLAKARSASQKVILLFSAK